MLLVKKIFSSVTRVQQLVEAPGW